MNVDPSALLSDLNYRVITSTLDRIAHVKSYGGWAHHPNPGAMRVVLERNVLELNARRAAGGVMAEGSGS